MNHEKEDGGKVNSLPQIEIPVQLDEDIEKFAGSLGLPSEKELSEDWRLARIWRR